MSNMSVPAAPVHMSMSHTNSHLLVVGYVAGTVSAVEISGTDASLTKITSISQHNGTSKCDPSTPAGGRYVHDLDSQHRVFSFFSPFFPFPLLFGEERMHMLLGNEHRASNFKRNALVLHAHL